MANTFSKLYIHLVFAVKGRGSLLQKPWREEVFRYIGGIVKNKEQQSVIINGFSDHVHILLMIKPNICLSSLVRDIKTNSSRFINQKSFVRYKFAWQDGYGAFTCSESQIPIVYSYILNQEKHHQSISFIDEYKRLLDKSNIKYDARFLFDVDNNI